MRKLTLAIAIMASTAIGGNAYGEEVEDIFIDATYYQAPTEWCPTGKGIPLVVDIRIENIVAVSKDKPNKIRENHGTTMRHTHVFGGDFNVSDTAPVIGEFTMKLNSCFNLWSNFYGSGVWQILSDDGGLVQTGRVDRFAPMFRFRPVNNTAGNVSRVHHMKLGSQVLFKAGQGRQAVNQFVAVSEE